jgi:glycosyltransferase involved in cell wall biosynthesis
MRLREAKWRTEYLRYNQSNPIITMSRTSYQRLSDLGINKSNIHVVPYGVEMPDKPKERIPSELVRCLAVGRMVAKKAPILTLDAFRRASEATSNLHLDYIGAGELLPAAQQFVRAFDLGTRVTFHGGKPNQTIQKLMNEVAIFVQHSMTDPETGDEEGLPVAILEAMAAALPVVSTQHAGIPEAVVDGFTGYFVDEGDSAAMAERLIALVRNDELRRQMGIAGWQRARERFTWRQERAALRRIMGFEA